MARYLATINTPGYLPQDDEPPVFDTPTAAWEYLADERERQEDGADYGDADTGEYSGTVTYLRYIASGEHIHGSSLEDYPTNADGTGTVYGPTPGYEGGHDLGVAYSVTQVERVSGRCPCCGDDVTVMDAGFCCDDCDAAGCEVKDDACGERAYWECQRTDSLADTEDDAGCTCARIPGSLDYTKCEFCTDLESMRFNCADCGRTDVRASERVKTHGGFVCTTCQKREGYATLAE